MDQLSIKFSVTAHFCIQPWHVLKIDFFLFIPCETYIWQKNYNRGNHQIQLAKDSSSTSRGHIRRSLAPYLNTLSLILSVTATILILDHFQYNRVSSERSTISNITHFKSIDDIICSGLGSTFRL